MAVRRTGPGVATLTAALRALEGVQARVGWFETAKYKDGTPVAYVAAIHEFGYPEGGIPARPFMRPTVAEKSGEWTALLERGARAVLRGQSTPSDVLEIVAMRAAADIGGTISNVTTPPLAPATIRRKGHAKPLVDSGQMRRSVTGVVEPSS